MVERDAPVVLACRAVIDRPRWRWRCDSGTCASARCKAVDTRTRRSIATAADQRCALAADDAGRLAAVRELCAQMAAQLGEKIASRQETRTIAR